MKTWRKTIAAISTFALLLNSLSAPIAVLAQESPTPKPTFAPTDSPLPTETAAPTETPTTTPDATVEPTETPTTTPEMSPTVTIAPSPDASPAATDSASPTPSDQPVVTQSQDSNPTTQGPPSDTNQPVVSEPSASPSMTPTATPTVPEKEGELTTTVIENVDLSSIKELNCNVDLNLCTDKADYAPTDIVYVYGRDFTPDKTYLIVISSSDDPPVSSLDDSEDDHRTTDSQGTFSYAYQLDGILRPNYKVEVKDGDFVIAQATFTDGYDDKIVWCHVEPNGNSQTLHLPPSALRSAGHMDASGNPLHAGDHIGSCSTGTLRVNKVTVPSGDTNHFSISITGTGTVSGSDSYNDFATNHQKTFSVTQGVYSVAESSESGWAITGNTCQNITVLSGTTVNCTITNSKTGSISGYKFNDKNEDGNQDGWWDLDWGGWHWHGEEGLNGWKIFIDIGDKNGVWDTGEDFRTTQHTDNWNGDRDDEGYFKFNNLIPGEYKVCEVLQSGWTNITPICQIINVGADENKHVNFGNHQSTNGTLVVNKVVDPSTDAGKFNLRIDGATAGTGANVGNGGSTGAVSVSSGNHTVSETAGTGTNLSNYTSVISGDCNSLGVVNVPAGASKSCTITNTRNTGTVVVHKDVQGPNGEDVVDTTGTFKVMLDGGSEEEVMDDGVVTYKGVLTGTHTITESFIPSGYSFYQYSLDGDAGVGGAQVTVSTNTETHITITNRQDSGYIRGHKYHSVGDQFPISPWPIHLSSCNSDFSVCSEIQVISSNLLGYMFGPLNPGYYRVAEELNSGYTPVGVTYYDIILTPGMNSRDNDFYNFENIDITVCKVSDADGDLETTEDRDPVPGWEMELVKTPTNSDTTLTRTIVLDDPNIQRTGDDGCTTFANLGPADNYTVNEIMEDGWTNLTPTSHDFGTPQDWQDQTWTFVNMEEAPKISISKSNNRGDGMNAGNTVDYSITLTNEGNIPLYDVTIQDILPGGFSYVPGSTWGETSADPSISGSVLTWSGFQGLSVGSSITIHYQTVSSSDLADGLYVNFATCNAVRGQYLEKRGEVRGVECDPTNSTVKIGNGVSFGGSLGGQVLGISTVLGASTELPATGSSTELLVVALIALGVGLFLRMYDVKITRKLTKKVVRSAQKKGKKHAKK
jgi:uncharacterized repeat protein (TIGR01451 family)